jgi:hypothetical protein
MPEVFLMESCSSLLKISSQVFLFFFFFRRDFEYATSFSSWSQRSIATTILSETVAANYEMLKTLFSLSLSLSLSSLFPFDKFTKSKGKKSPDYERRNLFKLFYILASRLLCLNNV